MPLAITLVRPSPVRAKISDRSNSASPPRTVSISLPCGVVVSAQGSARDRKPAPFSATVASTLRRSLVLLASRSSLALQLLYLKASESMGNHDSEVVDADSVD